jgi:hypothetical protein
LPGFDTDEISACGGPQSEIRSLVGVHFYTVPVAMGKERNPVRLQAFEDDGILLEKFRGEGQLAAFEECLRFSVQQSLFQFPASGFFGIAEAYEMVFTAITYI